MITSYDSFVQYFRDLVASHTSLQTFEVGNSERILSRERSELTYPLLWLEYPDISMYWQGGYKGRYASAFLVLLPAPADDWTQEEADLNTALQYCYEILAKMNEDSEEGEFEFELEKCALMPKEKWSGDNDWGWRVDFSIIGAIDDCVNDAVWQ